MSSERPCFRWRIWVAQRLRYLVGGVLKDVDVVSGVKEFDNAFLAAAS